MKKIYCLNVILTSNKDQLNIVSTDPEEAKPPVHDIMHSRFLHQESRYIIRNFFEEHNPLFADNFDYNFLSIQDEDSIKYVMEHSNFDRDNDILITYGGFSMMNKLKDKLNWVALSSNQNNRIYCSNDQLNSIIDNVIHKSTF